MTPLIKRARKGSCNTEPRPVFSPIARVTRHPSTSVTRHRVTNPDARLLPPIAGGLYVCNVYGRKGEVCVRLLRRQKQMSLRVTVTFPADETPSCLLCT